MSENYWNMHLRPLKSSTAGFMNIAKKKLITFVTKLKFTRRFKKNDN